MDDKLSVRITRIERINRFLLVVVSVQFILMVAFFAFIYQNNHESDQLKAKALIIVDEKGIERVRIAGTMPNAVINGKEVKRGDSAAGVMLYDQDGQERGGYLTFGNGHVALTLDSKKQQTALFVAGPDGGTALQMWADKTSIELRSDSDGSRFTATKDGKVMLQQPNNIRIGTNMCQAYRASAKKYPVADVLGSCHKRFNESACHECFEGVKK